MSRRLDTQLFSVVGPCYVPEHPGDYAREVRALPAPRTCKPGVLLCTLAVIGALIAGTVVVADDVTAAIRQSEASAAPQRSVGPVSVSIVTPAEPVNW